MVGSSQNILRKGSQHKPNKFRVNGRENFEISIRLMVVRSFTCKSSVCPVPIPNLPELPLSKASETSLQYLTRKTDYKKTVCSPLVLKEREVPLQPSQLKEVVLIGS